MPNDLLALLGAQSLHQQLLTAGVCDHQSATSEKGMRAQLACTGVLPGRCDI
jgi:hypothetical protein